MQRTLLLLAALFALMIGALPTHAQSTRPLPRGESNPIPQVPVVLDGVRVAPLTLRRYDGQDLHYVLDGNALQQGFIYVFTTKAKRDAFVQTLTPQSSGTIRPLGLNGTWFYEHDNFGGAAIEFWGYVASLGWWNDRISSLYTAYGTTVLYEHAGYSGATFTISGQHYIYALSPWRWNDVVSSIAFY
ncbi:MAG TPA: beta/gamma crystallin-related protein [Roseiflexaceae bacterium]|nr:beta/gamma crystallin-related protein [Roseiflexaceae bacterium]